MRDESDDFSHFLALSFFVFSQSPLDQHWALSVALTTEDRFVTFVKFAFAPTDAKEGIKKEGTEQTARHVADLARQLGGKEYFGTTFSFADITVWDWIDQVSGAFSAKAEVDKHDNMRSWHARVAALPRLQTYWAGKK